MAFLTITLTATLLFFSSTFANVTVDPAPYGTYGTLVIYGTDVNLPLDYLGSFEDADYAQSLCDNPEKGVITDFDEYYGYDVSLTVADHKNQGFDALYDVIPDETTCEMFYPDGTSQKFICRKKTNGDNIDGEIFYDGKEVELVYPSDWISMYTCNPEGWWSITVTFWEPLYD